MEEKATAAGFTHEELMKFEATGGIVTKDNMGEVSRLYGVDQSQLREGMAMRGTWTGSGFDNVVATEENFTSSKGMSGDLRTSFGDDGQMSRAEFSGVANGQKTNITWDGDGQVYKSSQSGFESSYVNFTSSKTGHQNENLNIDRNITEKTTQVAIGKEFNIKNASMEAMLRGDMSDAIGGFAFSDKDLGHAMASMQASAMGQYLSQSISSGSSLDASAGAGLSFDIKAINAKLGTNISASASDSETINAVTTAYQAKYDEIYSNSSLSAAGKIEAWNGFSAGNMAAVMEASGDTKGERLANVVAGNVDGVMDYFSADAVMDRMEKAAENDPSLAKQLDHGSNRW